ncbi:hypothetical protein EDB89DRAFT_1973213 [Lactarius sanguifluus]|nr:hypothetical protein EDB89DRAFT_1973213 [Lactarius sanguifluus]
MADALVPQDLKTRETASSGPSTAASLRSSSATLSIVHRVRTPYLSLTAVPPAHLCASTHALFMSHRTAAAVDPFTLTKKRSNKVREAVRQAAASVSLEMVVVHMRCFVEDFGSAPRPSLPPMSRHALKSVHELANAFNLKSKGEGNGAARFTRPAKTTLSGVRADERNVALILVKPLLPPHGSGGAREREGKAGRKIHPLGGKAVGGVHFYIKL